MLFCKFFIVSHYILVIYFGHVRVVVLKMAEPARRRAVRPRLPGSVKYIRLRESVFTLWRQKKENTGFGDSTDSEFAEYLLHRRYSTR